MHATGNGEEYGDSTAVMGGPNLWSRERWSPAVRYSVGWLDPDWIYAIEAGSAQSLVLSPISDADASADAGRYAIATLDCPSCVAQATHGGSDLDAAPGASIGGTLVIGYRSDRGLKLNVNFWRTFYKRRVTVQLLKDTDAFDKTGGTALYAVLDVGEIYYVAFNRMAIHVCTLAEAEASIGVAFGDTRESAFEAARARCAAPSPPSVPTSSCCSAVIATGGGLLEPTVYRMLPSVSHNERPVYQDYEGFYIAYDGCEALANCHGA